MLFLFDCMMDPGNLALPQAHQAMQIHKCCTTENCMVRRRARQVLVELGEVVLSLPQADLCGPPLAPGR
ncbi:hypothetical protein OG300_01610 [Nocardia sp. NBC_00511]